MRVTIKTQIRCVRITKERVVFRLNQWSECENWKGSSFKG